MQPNTLVRSPKLLKHALLVMATLYIILYFALAIIRIQYPFELEWAEGGQP